MIAIDGSLYIVAIGMAGRSRRSRNSASRMARRALFKFSNCNNSLLVLVVLTLVTINTIIITIIIIGFIDIITICRGLCRTCFVRGCLRQMESRVYVTVCACDAPHSNCILAAHGPGTGI